MSNKKKLACKVFHDSTETVKPSSIHAKIIIIILLYHQASIMASETIKRSIEETLRIFQSMWLSNNALHFFNNSSSASYCLIMDSTGIAIWPQLFKGWITLSSG